MHEMSIAQSILDIAREEMVRHNVAKLEAVNIAVGALSAVVPGSLTFCWQVLTDGTDMASVKLQIREVPLGYRCFDCGEEFTSEKMVFECLKCGADTPMLTTGRDMTIESIEAAED
jgi:hydrogenase nickel incorporation protein HypA/HybF